MSFEVSPTRDFLRDLKRLSKRYASISADVEQLGERLAAEPHLGDAMGQGCYKVRMAIRSKGQGKSGGARVITCVVAVREKVYLLSIYDKSEQSTLVRERLQQMLDDLGL